MRPLGLSQGTSERRFVSGKLQNAFEIKTSSRDLSDVSGSQALVFSLHFYPSARGSIRQLLTETHVLTHACAHACTHTRTHTHTVRTLPRLPKPGPCREAQQPPSHLRGALRISVSLCSLPREKFSSLVQVDPKEHDFWPKLNKAGENCLCLELCPCRRPARGALPRPWAGCCPHSSWGV